MAVNKQFRLVVYDKSLNYLGSLPNIAINGFRKVINGGLGDLFISLPMQFQDGYTSPLTTPFNYIQVYCSDGDTPPEGVLLYSGFIVSRNPHINGSSEGVTLVARGHVARFASLPMRDGSNNYFSISSQAPANINDGNNVATASEAGGALKNIIGRYRADSLYPIINFSSTSIPTTAYTVTQKWISTTILNAINSVTNVLPAGSYWYVGANNIISLGVGVPTTPNHILAFGTQITSWDDSESMDGMVNSIVAVWGVSGFSRFHRSTSETAWGDWWRFDNVKQITAGDDILNYTASQISAYGAPIRRLIIKVPDSNGASGNRKSGYDIELFEPGQWVQIVNLPAGVQQALPTMFQIQAVDYTPDEATLELVKLSDSLARDYAQRIINQNQLTNNGNPDTIDATYAV